MLSDYVMNSIDNIFSDKLNKISNNPSKGTPQPKPSFNRQTIKHNLPNIIRKSSEASRSPAYKKGKSPSPISKSRLKDILENNKFENIKSVVKKCKESTSPYKKMMPEATGKSKDNLQVLLKNIEPCNKQNDMIKYYRDERKSMEKTLVGDRSVGKIRKSRIFMKQPLLSHQVSKNDFR